MATPVTRSESRGQMGAIGQLDSDISISMLLLLLLLEGSFVTKGRSVDYPDRQVMWQVMTEDSGMQRDTLLQ